VIAILSILLVISATALVTYASANGNGGTWTVGYNAGTHDALQSGYKSGNTSGYNQGKADVTNQDRQAIAKAYTQGRIDMYHETFDWFSKNCKTEYVADDMATEMVCDASQPADTPSPYKRNTLI
jgi:hypothetical protein